MVIIELDSYNFEEAKVKLCQHLIDSKGNISNASIAKELGLNERTIYRMIADGRLVVPARGGKRVFDEVGAIQKLKDRGYKIEKI